MSLIHNFDLINLRTHIPNSRLPLPQSCVDPRQQMAKKIIFFNKQTTTGMRKKIVKKTNSCLKICAEQNMQIIRIQNKKTKTSSL